MKKSELKDLIMECMYEMMSEDENDNYNEYDTSESYDIDTIVEMTNYIYYNNCDVYEEGVTEALLKAKEKAAESFKNAKATLKKFRTKDQYDSYYDVDEKAKKKNNKMRTEGDVVIGRDERYDAFMSAKNSLFADIKKYANEIKSVKDEYNALLNTRKVNGALTESEREDLKVYNEFIKENTVYARACSEALIKLSKIDTLDAFISDGEQVLRRLQEQLQNRNMNIISDWETMPAHTSTEIIKTKAKNVVCTLAGIAITLGALTYETASKVKNTIKKKSSDDDEE